MATACYNPSMARPKKDEALGAYERIALRITPTLRAKLDAMAKTNKWSLSDEIRAALERHAGRVRK
jgi:predicted HicB family RNase H-like nuclease